MRTVVGCKEKHSQVELSWLEVADFRAVLPKHGVEGDSGVGKPSEPGLKFLEEQPRLLGPAGVDFQVQRMDLIDVVLVDAVERVFLSLRQGVRHCRG